MNIRAYQMCQCGRGRKREVLINLSLITGALWEEMQVIILTMSMNESAFCYWDPLHHSLYLLSLQTSDLILIYFGMHRTMCRNRDINRLTTIWTCTLIDLLYWSKRQFSPAFFPLHNRLSDLIGMVNVFRTATKYSLKCHVFFMSPV